MYSLKANLDPSGLEKAFEKMRVDARAQGKGLAFENAKFFVRLVKKIAREESTPDKAEIESKRSLGYRLKIRTPNITTVQGWYKRDKAMRENRAAIIDQEINRRLRARGTFAKGWRFWKFVDTGDTIRIWIKNTVGYAETINNRDHTAEKASEYVAKTFQKKLHSLAQKLTSNFGK